MLSLRQERLFARFRPLSTFYFFSTHSTSINKPIRLRLNKLYTRFIPVWKEAPFLRFLPPLVAGIILGWYLESDLRFSASICLATGLFLAIGWTKKYRPGIVFGIALNLFFIGLGLVLVVLKDTRNHHDFIGRHYQPGYAVQAILQEPLVSKPKSFKAEAWVNLLDSEGQLKPVKGGLILYLEKDSSLPQLPYGTRIVFTKELQPIKNSGNPGGFDYQRYSAFKNLYYQVFLKTGEYRIESSITINPFQQTLLQTRTWVLRKFKQYIPGKEAAGLAEALLIGYKDDLDRNLVEQYADTGVVHIIAISGMHLGLLYGLLLLLLKPLAKRRYGKLLSALLTIGSLWFFSLLTGAAPSITRAALMFSIIVLANLYSQKNSIYNSLAVSAFFLLLFNPFNLWDIGFQLSYAALLSIVVFSRPITNWYHAPFGWMQKVWQLMAVTLAAQILTLPLAVYHFHQFPVYFLLANLIAVPLSSLILYGLLLLLAVSWIGWLAKWLGIALAFGIDVMNGYIGWVAQLPGATIGGVYYTIPQTVALFGVIAGLAWWLMGKGKNGLITGLSFLTLLAGLRFYQYVKTSKQQRVIVYNVPQKTAIDLVFGRNYRFIGDSLLFQDDFLQNFHLQPSRILHQADFAGYYPIPDSSFVQLKLGKQRLVILDKSLELSQSSTLKTDYLLVTGAMRTKPMQVLERVSCNTIILDGSNSYWRVGQWKSAADSLHLRLHSVQDAGAFVLDY